MVRKVPGEVRGNEDGGRLAQGGPGPPCRPTHRATMPPMTALSDARPASPASRGRVGEPLPPLALPRLDGEILDLAELRGRRVALCFWGSW